MSAFRVGQKVVCVDASGFVAKGVTVPVLGQVYTVREFSIRGGIWLREIVNPPRFYKEGLFEKAWYPRRFRPVSYPKRDQSEDVALIKSLLAPERRSASRPVSASAASIVPTAKQPLSAFSGEGA